MTILPALALAGALMTQTAPDPAPPPAQAEAIALARSGEYRQALDAFRRIVAANAADHDARVWIARLHGWMGDPAQAETVYRSVLRENPEHVDAMVGLGGILVNLGRPAEAAELLTAAERRAPASPDVLAALARAYQRLARTSLALQYIERAVAIAPTPDNRLAREQIRTRHAHRVESNSWLETFGAPVPDGRTTDLAVNVRLHDRLRASGRGQLQKKFGVGEQRAGAGVEWLVQPQTALAVAVLAGPGNEVLPRADASLEATHALGRFEWAAGYRYVEFATARASVVSPGVTLWAGEAVSLASRYYLAFTTFDSGLAVQPSHSGLVRASYRPFPRLWVSGGYSRGTENFETLSPDRIGEFHANTVSGSLRLDLPGLTSIGGAYERQWRSGGTEMGRLTLSFVQRF